MMFFGGNGWRLCCISLSSITQGRFQLLLTDSCIHFFPTILFKREDFYLFYLINCQETRFCYRNIQNQHNEILLHHLSLITVGIITLWREKFNFYAKLMQQLILFIMCAENFSVDIGILELKVFIFWYHWKTKSFVSYLQCKVLTRK